MDFESKPKAFSHSFSLEIMCLNGGESSQKYGGLTKVGGGGGGNKNGEIQWLQTKGDCGHHHH